MNFNEELSRLSSLVEKFLEEHFDKLQEKVSEKKLIESMRYSLMAGGKRIRPVLAISTANMLSVPVDEVMPIAAAIEMIHTYSLIHDDLPAMDDDDFRRGKPTNHKVFGEAMAILSGDALLNEAFELLMQFSASAGANMQCAIEAASVVANAAGKHGMIAGQVIDMESEQKSIPSEVLKDMHRKKTGALLKASVLAPAAYACAPTDTVKALSEYAECIGIAFQIKDDMMDVESTTEALGKPTGSDAKNHKTTYVTLYGLENAKKLLAEYTQKAVQVLAPFGEKAWFLQEIAHFIAARTH